VNRYIVKSFHKNRIGPGFEDYVNCYHACRMGHSFGGSGTTLASAIKHGRRFLGVDLRPSQIELCKRRVKQATLERGLI
jgi:hypothetical protein